ncbi:pentatricopeptide repeat-containing protein, partial [Tanacetum coccineum]
KDRVKIGVESDIYVATSLVTMYFKCKDYVGGSKVFESMSYRNVECYNVFFTGLLQNGSCGQLKSLKFGRELHGLLVKVGLTMLNVSFVKQAIVAELTQPFLMYFGSHSLMHEIVSTFVELQ